MTAPIIVSASYARFEVMPGHFVWRRCAPCADSVRLHFRADPKDAAEVFSIIDVAMRRGLRAPLPIIDEGSVVLAHDGFEL